ncbi:putative baseplate assembly protein [Carbonactinospora thermoautotrophica]|nr:putative baseplate assembly protein [Carbonactinospora thermoautotrophica]
MTGRKCGCCRGTEAAASEVFNAGTHGEFLAAMLARLSSPAYPALRDLTVRTPDDPAIALLDAAAVLADLLTFYTERIAEEGYLRTATEQRSLELLGRLVGYRPRPGVAAGTYLAYTLDKDPRPGVDARVVIPRGARAQSVPAPGEAPQAFETADELPARWSWNELKVLTRRPYQLTPDVLAGRAELHLAGTATNLKPSDQLLFVFSAEQSADPRMRTLLPVHAVRVDRQHDVTVVELPREVASLADLKKTLEETLKGLLGGEGFPRGSRIAGRFAADVLRARLLDRLPALDTATEFADELAHVLERLVEAKELAAPYERVLAWFGAVEAALVPLRDKARALEPPLPEECPQPGEGTLYHALGLAAGDGDGEKCPDEPRNPAILGLGALLAALRKAPSRPPGSSRDLIRDPDALFAGGSDLGAQLLAALDPRLRDGLYQAWRRVHLTAPLALRDLQVMRVAATPFGATAPPQPVHDRDGRVTGYVDWPLTGNKLLGLRVEYTTGELSGMQRAVFTYVEGGSQVTHGVLLPSEGAVQLGFGSGSVRLTAVRPPENSGTAAPPAEPGVRVEFEADLPERTVFVSQRHSGGEHDGEIHVTVANGDTREFWLRPGDRRSGEHGDLSLEVGRESTATGEDVEIVFVSPGQPLSKHVIALDAVYDGIAPGSWVVIQRPRKGVDPNVPGDRRLREVITRVTGVRVVSRADFGITGKVSELTLADPWLDDSDTLLAHIRDATVYARGEPLEPATEPVTEDVRGRRIELADLYDGLTPGRWIVVTGERTDIPGTAGVQGAELAMIAGVAQAVAPNLPGDAVHTTIILATDLAYSYRRDTVRIWGNVVRATHGATRDEPIGSGDAGQANQTFTLWQGPLTWLAADTPPGAASTLEIRVDGVRWREVDSLAGRGPDERVYVTGAAEDGRTTVTFGDGVHGARLPTGHENVRARYRVGLGKPGNVKAGQVTQLTTRPLGVSAVTNPLPAGGGADADDASLARRGIPLAVTALDRLVGVPDYADFARSRAGIGRASARRVFDGVRELVHVTVAGVDDIPLTEDSDIVRTLRTSLATHGDPSLPVEVAVRELVLLVVAASIKVHPDHSWDLVEPAVRQALLDRLGFARRDLGQPAYLSEVLAAAQAVPGVEYVDVDVFAGVAGDLTPADLERLVERFQRPQPVVPARLAEYDVRRHTVQARETLTRIAARYGVSVAELLRLNPDITDTNPLPPGASVVVFRGIRPAQLVLLSPAVPDTLILKEVRS